MDTENRNKPDYQEDVEYYFEVYEKNCVMADICYRTYQESPKQRNYGKDD